MNFNPAKIIPTHKTLTTDVVLYVFIFSFFPCCLPIRNNNIAVSLVYVLNIYFRFLTGILIQNISGTSTKWAEKHAKTIICHLVI